MKVLSLFDGISCGRVALERAGIQVEEYYASEIDKYAMQVSAKNWPEIIQLGDCTKIDFSQYAGKIDLVIGGSPCQGFSFAGKQLNFDDPRSKLFFEFVRAVREIKPKYFLLENVKMKQEFQDVISEQLGVRPIEINSALVSAQNRKRLYWTNIQDISQPKDMGLYMRDIITGTSSDITKKMLDKRMGTLAHEKAWIKNIRRLDQKSKTLTAGIQNISNSGATNVLYDDGTYHKLNVVECERLQTLPDNYTAGVSDSQRYKMLGNGWTVDVIAHIFKGLKN